MDIIKKIINKISSNDEYKNNPINSNKDTENTNTNFDNNLKISTLDLDFDVVSNPNIIPNDLIIFQDKYFKDLESAVKHAVKFYYPYAYNIVIKNIKKTPTSIHVNTSFNYEEPKLIRKNFNILKKEYGIFFKENWDFYAIDRHFSQLEDAVKYLVKFYYGNYQNLKIIEIENHGNNYKVEVEFIDIPDIKD